MGVSCRTTPGLGAVDTWQVTRARPIIEGTLANFVDFRFTPDFGQGRTVIQDAFITARLTPEFRITVGKFKSPFGLERLQSANDIRFVARAFPTSLVPNRDIGLAFEGDVFGGRFSYARGIFERRHRWRQQRDARGRGCR